MNKRTEIVFIVLYTLSSVLNAKNGVIKINQILYNQL